MKCHRFMAFFLVCLPHASFLLTCFPTLLTSSPASLPLSLPACLLPCPHLPVMPASLFAPHSACYLPEYLPPCLPACSPPACIPGHLASCMFPFLHACSCLHCLRSSVAKATLVEATLHRPAIGRRLPPTGLKTVQKGPKRHRFTSSFY